MSTTCRLRPVDEVAVAADDLDVSDIVDFRVDAGRRHHPTLRCVVMPSPRKSHRTTALTIKVSPEFAREVRAWVKREAGRPLFVASLSAFAEAAIRREMQRLDLIVSGALPRDRLDGGQHDDPPGSDHSHRSAALNHR